MTAGHPARPAGRGRLGLRARLIAQAETNTLNIGDVRQVIRRVVVFSLAFEAVIALVLTVRFAAGYDDDCGPGRLLRGVPRDLGVQQRRLRALQRQPDGVRRRPVDRLPDLRRDHRRRPRVPGGVRAGRRWRTPKTWSVLTRITVVGTVAAAASSAPPGSWSLEWANPGTLGPLSPWGKVAGRVHRGGDAAHRRVQQPRHRRLSPRRRWLLNDALMFIGGGSAGTAGGIKVTTFGLLAYVLWAEMRGERDAEVGHRKMAGANQRQALTMALLGIGVIAIATLLMQLVTDFALDQVLFEVISAFATVGLSTGITADLPPAAQVTARAAHVRRPHRAAHRGVRAGAAEPPDHYQLPEESTIVG